MPTLTSHPPEAAPDRSRMVEVNATTLRIWEWGTDDPATPLVLLAHGAFDHGRMMDGLGQALAARGFRCWAPDLRGHGDSGRVPHGSTFEPMITDIGSLVRPVDGRIGLLGHSMGGSLAMQAAAVWPERFDWVVSLDSVGPPASALEDPGLAEQSVSQFSGLIKALSRSARVFTDKQAMFDQRASLNTRIPIPWLWHLVEHGTVAVDGGWRWKYDSLFNTWLPNAFHLEWVLEDFKAIRTPLLSLTGGVDELWSDVPLRDIETRLALIERAEHHVVPDAGHYVHLENESFVLDRIDRFVSEVGW